MLLRLSLQGTRSWILCECAPKLPLARLSEDRSKTFARKSTNLTSKGLKRSNAGSLLVKVFIAVLAFLSSTPIPIYKHRLEKRPSQIAKIQIMELKGAFQLFSWDTGRYPTTSEGLDALVRKPGNLESWRGPYLPNPDKPEPIG
jgi:general secretion pathway protein G